MNRNLAARIRLAPLREVFCHAVYVTLSRLSWFP